MKFFNYFIVSFLFGLFSLSNVFAQSKVNSPATQFVLTYSNEFIFASCVVMLFLGCWLSVTLPTDPTVKPELSTKAKVLSALSGGILAFIFSIHSDKALTLMNPLWIFATAIAFPVTILTLRSRLKSYSNNMTLGSNQQDKGE